MSPGKLPHAKRFNVQKDERTDRLQEEEEEGGAREQDEARESAAA